MISLYEERARIVAALARTCRALGMETGFALDKSLITLGADVEATISNIQAKRLHALSNPSFNDWLRRPRQAGVP